MLFPRHIFQTIPLRNPMLLCLSNDLQMITPPFLNILFFIQFTISFSALFGCDFSDYCNLSPIQHLGYSVPLAHCFQQYLPPPLFSYLIPCVEAVLLIKISVLSTHCQIICSYLCSLLLSYLVIPPVSLMHPFLLCCSYHHMNML